MYSSIRNDLKFNFKTQGYLTKIIYLNVGIFIIFLILGVFFKIFHINNFTSIFYLPSNNFLFQPWSILTYSFFHSGFLHLFFNMIILHFSGKIFLRYFSNDNLLGVYILGGIVSAILFLFSTNYIPFLSTNKYYLLGASSAVYSILFSVIFKKPNLSVRLFFTTEIKIWHLGGLIFFLSFINLSENNNYGGFISHIGGIATSFIFVSLKNNNIDITKFITNLFNTKIIFSDKDNNYINKDYSYNEKKNNKQKEVDKILEKISKKGYDSLSKKEKKILFDSK